MFYKYIDRDGNYNHNHSHIHHHTHTHNHTHGQLQIDPVYDESKANQLNRNHDHDPNRDHNHNHNRNQNQNHNQNHNHNHNQHHNPQHTHAVTHGQLRVGKIYHSIQNGDPNARTLTTAQSHGMYIINHLNVDAQHNYVDSRGQFEIVYYDATPITSSQIQRTRPRAQFNHNHNHNHNPNHNHNHQQILPYLECRRNTNVNTTPLSSHGNLYRRDQHGEWSPAEINNLQMAMQTEISRLSDQLTPPPINLFQPNDIRVMAVTQPTTAAGTGAGNNASDTSSINNYHLEVIKHQTTRGNNDINVAAVKGSQMGVPDQMRVSHRLSNDNNNNNNNYWIDDRSGGTSSFMRHRSDGAQRSMTIKTGDTNTGTGTGTTETDTATGTGTAGGTGTGTGSGSGSGKISNFFDADMKVNKILKDEPRMTQEIIHWLNHKEYMKC